MQRKVLLLSQRRVADLVAFCLNYEFEDVFAGVTDAERVDVIEPSNLEFCRRVYKYLRLTSGSPALARTLTPYPRNKVMLERDFELFFPVFSNAYQLYSLAMIPNWRQRCRKAACFINEVWVGLLPEYLVELLSEFDHIFIGLRHSVQEVARITGRPCSYLPAAADVLRFAPQSIDQQRAIEVCNIGRRSPVTHQALLQDADRRGSFYYYDTVAASGSDGRQRTFRVDNAHEHRIMFATILKHSRYFIANRSHVNNPEFTAGREEISARFYEGAAAGAVMIGEAPPTPDFQKQFDWPDAVIPVPFHSPDIGQILAELNNDPARVLAIGRQNLREAALKHDWLYRIRELFDVLGLEPTEKMQARALRLGQVASMAQDASH